MVRSSIDLGTNTCLLLIADWAPGEREPRRIVGDHHAIVRLGQGVDRARAFAPEAMARALKCLKGYATRVREAGAGASATVCVATSQARDAANSGEFFERVRRETGFAFRVISGDEEARMTFDGALLPGIDATSAAVIDIGGGSTEITTAAGGKSVDAGSVRFTERYLKSDPVTDAEFWACQEAVDAALGGFRGWREGLAADVRLIGVAGTVTSLAGWHLGLKAFEPRALDGATLTRGDVHRLVEELKWRTVAERRALPGMDAGRADILLAGGLILWRAMELLRFPELEVSTRGLRYGALRLG